MFKRKLSAIRSYCTGDIPPEYGSIVDTVMQKYPNVINVTNKTANVVRELLSGVDGLTVSTVGTHVVLRGDVNRYDIPIIEKVIKKFEEIMDLTTSSGAHGRPHDFHEHQDDRVQ